MKSTHTVTGKSLSKPAGPRPQLGLRAKSDSKVLVEPLETNEPQFMTIDDVSLSKTQFDSNENAFRTQGYLKTGVSAALGVTSAALHLPRTILAPMLAYTNEGSIPLSTEELRKANVGRETSAVIGSLTGGVAATVFALGAQINSLLGGAFIGGLAGLGTYLTTATGDLDLRSKPFFNQDRISAAKTAAFNNTEGPLLRKRGAALLAGYREALQESYERGAEIVGL